MKKGIGIGFAVLLVLMIGIEIGAHTSRANSFLGTWRASDGSELRFTSTDNLVYALPTGEIIPYSWQWMDSDHIELILPGASPQVVESYTHRGHLFFPLTDKRLTQFEKVN